MALNEKSSLIEPIGTVTRFINMTLSKSVELLFHSFILLFLICLTFVIVGGVLISYSYEGIGFAILLAPFAIPIIIFILWAAVSTYLVMVFGAVTEGKSVATMFFCLFILPTVLIIAFEDVYLTSIFPGEVIVYTFTGLVVVNVLTVVKFGDFLADKCILMARLVNGIFIFALFETYYPWPETKYDILTFQDCRFHDKDRSHRGIGTSSWVECLATFELDDGSEMSLYLNSGNDKVVAIRHGFFKHYRSTDM